ncbi:MAG: hypothetical protein NC911_04830 [Candidatus Omnitrophica bacterium]|nr:hypothetical protein [Candidatus Omnitrophota bacterium]
MATIYSDRVEELACRCCQGHIATFKVVKDGLQCVWCGNKIAARLPVEFVIKGECECTPAGDRTTFVVDSDGVKTCTRCGKIK